MMAHDEDLPPFQPRFIDEPGMGLYYEDGVMLAAVDRWEHDGKRGINISESTSNERGRGASERALRWLRTQCDVIAAVRIGSHDEEGWDISANYWFLMRDRGLVDVLIDDEGQEVGPQPADPPDEAPVAPPTMRRGP